MQQHMTHQNLGRPGRRKVRTPLWRRITALFTLSSMVIVGGLVLAAVITLTIVMFVFVIERAIA